MKAHEELGCLASFTCAPYQTTNRPRFGSRSRGASRTRSSLPTRSSARARTATATHRSVLRADRTCAGVGLHLDEPRRGRILFRLTGFGDSPSPTDALFVATGLIIGSRSGDRVPVIDGLPPPRSEDQLKALGAAARASGAVALFHAVGITPEAPTLADAFGGGQPEQTWRSVPPMSTQTLQRLSTVPDGAPVPLCPRHAAFLEASGIGCCRLRTRAGARPIYVNTGRAARRRSSARLAGWPQTASR